MQMKSLGRTGFTVSELCLGTMTWGSQSSEAEGHAQLDRAMDAGINFIDTAEMYPVNPVTAETAGDTEMILGNWLKKRGNLRRLQTDVIDIYQLHWPDRPAYNFRRNWTFNPSSHDRAAIVAHMTDMLEAAQKLIAVGKIHHFALSNETAWGMAMWLRIAEENSLPRVASIQNEYSLLARLADTDLAELCHNEEVPLLSYSPLAAGLLSGKYVGGIIPEGSRRSRTPDLGGRVTPRVDAAVAAYVEIAQRHGLNPAAMAIAWPLTRPFPVVPIIGATTSPQLEIALSAAGLTLSAEVLAEIEAAHKAHPMPF